jgi:deoxycytidylate deaminase
MVPNNVVQYAQKVAREHDIPYPHRVCALLYSGSRVVAWGVNQPHKTHPKANTPYRTIHAELDVILRASRFGYDVSELSLYVHRIRRDKRDGISKPCVWCQRLIKDCGIKEVNWSVSGK